MVAVAPNAADTIALSRLQCWGDFAIVDAATGDDLKPRGRKARGLLAYLALHPDKAISRERLIGLFWGDRAEEQARASLRQTIFELKAFTNGARGLLTVERDHLVLNSTSLITDLGELRDSAQRGDIEALLQRLPDRDEPLFANLEAVDQGFDDWLRIERVRQEEALIAVVADAATAGLALGDTRAARALLVRLREFEAPSPGDAGSGPDLSVPDQSAVVRSTPLEGSILGSGAAAVIQSPLPMRGVPPSQPSPSAFLVHGQRRRMLIFLALGPAIGVATAGVFWGLYASLPARPTAIAVLPFKDLSGRGRDYFAEGLSEEILGQLARNPRLRVIGRVSSERFATGARDVRAIGQSLGVEYLLDGSVRRAGDQVRVNVALIRSRDGVQVWAQRYDGRLDDILGIQDGIGRAVEGRLRSQLASDGGRTASTIATRGDVYNLYLTARGLLRERHTATTDAAVSLLRKAVDLDPNYAPAWASLGAGVKLQSLRDFRQRRAPWSTLGAANKQRQGFDRDPKVAAAVDAEATRYVKKALALAPDLAEAHSALGMILEFRGPTARAHMQRSLQLNPNSAEAWTWLSQIDEGEGDYPQVLNSLRHAASIDPLWPRAFIFASRWAWQMGYRDEALAHVQTVQAGGTPFDRQMIRGNLAFARGDLAEAARRAKAAALVGSPEQQPIAEFWLGFALQQLGYRDAARRLTRIDESLWGLWQGQLPAPGVLRAHYADAAHIWDDGDYIYVAVRLLLNAGREAEVVQLYDLAFASPEEMTRHPGGRAAFLTDAPLVAVALRRVGRGGEADRLLAAAAAAAQDSLRRGRTPLWFPAVCAQVWALQGDHSAALSALERSMSQGWYYADPVSMSDIGGEPAFQALRDEPRFERIRSRLHAHIERERRALGPITS